MATTCQHRLKLQLLNCARSWARSFSSAPKKDENKSTESPTPETWGPEDEKDKVIFDKDKDLKIFWGNEPIPDRFKGDHLPNPVRNTEREYYQTHLNPEWEGHERGPFDSRFYSKKHGVSREFMSWLHWDININDNDELLALTKRKQFANLKHDQRYLEKRTKALGHELGAAHFIVARGGAVKFEGRDHWFVKDSNNQYALPRKYVDGLFVEAIDASNMMLTYVAFDVLGHLSKLRYLKFDNCPHLDDWCLARLQRFGQSLEFLDVRNCPNITDNGISSLQCLDKLQGLCMENLTGVKHLGLLTLLLEEQIPDLKILGVTEEQLKPPSWNHRGERRLVKALLGYIDEEKDGDNIGIVDDTTDDDNVLKRGIRRVD